MADGYIRREDAINIAESYEVKRDGFHLNDYEYGRDQVANSIAGDLEDIPAADVVPVVRCKDCERSEYDVVFEQYWCNLKRIVRPDGFCDLGKRREE